MLKTARPQSVGPFVSQGADNCVGMSIAISMWASLRQQYCKYRVHLSLHMYASKYPHIWKQIGTFAGSARTIRLLLAATFKIIFSMLMPSLEHLRLTTNGLHTNATSMVQPPLQPLSCCQCSPKVQIMMAAHHHGAYTYSACDATP